jgi:hypothetical protein
MNDVSVEYMALRFLPVAGSKRSARVSKALHAGQSVTKADRTSTSYQEEDTIGRGKSQLEMKSVCS